MRQDLPIYRNDVPTLPLMLAVDSVRATEARYVVVLEAKVIRVPVLKFGVLQIILYYNKYSNL